MSHLRVDDLPIRRTQIQTISLASSIEDRVAALRLSLVLHGFLNLKVGTSFHTVGDALRALSGMMALLAEGFDCAGRCAVVPLSPAINLFKDEISA